MSNEADLIRILTVDDHPLIPQGSLGSLRRNLI
jgi:hypothetical protein